MKRFEVIPLACSGKGNRVFKNGDIVFENNFPEGSIPGLIADGFLKPLEDETEEMPISTENSDHTAETSAETTETETAEETATVTEESAEETKAENLDETEKSEATETANVEVVTEETATTESNGENVTEETAAPSTEETVETAAEETTTENATAEATATTEEIKVMEKSFDEWKVVDMRTKLRELKIQFEPSANKEELFELLKKA